LTNDRKESGQKSVTRNEMMIRFCQFTFRKVD